MHYASAIEQKQKQPPFPVCEWQPTAVTSKQLCSQAIKAI